MASDPLRASATKGSKRKPTTLDSFCKNGAQGTGETGEEGRQGTSPKATPPSQGENGPQAFIELQSKVMRIEEIWQEKWETDQKENNSLRGRILQLETEAQKSNEIMKARNEQLEAMTAEIQSLKTRMEQMEARNEQLEAKTSENQSLKTRIEQMETNEHKLQQELIKQSQKIANLESVIKNLSDQVTDQENRS